MRKMPEFKPTSVDERIRGRKPKHHSITDWDFSSVDWTLDETIYHTAIPSLHGTTGAPCHSLVKNATTGALSDGRMIMWIRGNYATYLVGLLFRNQATDGGADNQNQYMFRIMPDELTFAYYLVGGYNAIDAKAMTWEWALETWYKIRLTWWTSVDRIYVRMERWTGTEWVTLGGAADTDFEDVNDRWKDNPVNRCGIYLDQFLWVDDLEVWG